MLGALINRVPAVAVTPCVLAALPADPRLPAADPRPYAKVPRIETKAARRINAGINAGLLLTAFLTLSICFFRTLFKVARLGKDLVKLR